ncbi:MAG TPA: M67 family metallopeptidase [Anaerolineales bacterium]|nr:M67 family metallopeptidase [Anaerolineales bacterium]
MKRELRISGAHWREMMQYVRRHAPLEACGLLAGRADGVEKVIFVRNRAQSPTRFVMDPHEQIKAFRWIESNGLELLGIFHSHPAGPADASPTDIAEAAYEVVHIIWSQASGHWQARGFWIESGHASEVSLQITE